MWSVWQQRAHRISFDDAGAPVSARLSTIFFFSALPTDKNVKNSWFPFPKKHKQLKGSDNCSKSYPLEQAPWPSFMNTACFIPASLAGLFGATERWDEQWHSGTIVANVTKAVTPWGMRGAQRIGENEGNTRVYQATLVATEKFKKRIIWSAHQFVIKVSDVILNAIISPKVIFCFTTASNDDNKFPWAGLELHFSTFLLFPSSPQLVKAPSLWLKQNWQLACKLEQRSPAAGPSWSWKADEEIQAPPSLVPWAWEELL